LFNEKGKLVFEINKDVLFCPWDNPEDALAVEMSQIPYNNGGLQPRYPTRKSVERKRKPPSADREHEPPLANLEGNLFIWGHGDRGHVIADGGNQSLTVRDLALLLERRGLRHDFKGHIILWTCWGGVAGGFARSLSRHLGNLGYAVPVWGSKYVTANMVSLRFLVIRKTPSDDVSNLSSSQAVRAYRSDMVFYPPSGAGWRQDPALSSASSSGSSTGSLSNWSAGLTPGSSPSVGTSSGWSRGAAPNSGSSSGSSSSSSSAFIGTGRK